MGADERKNLIDGFGADRDIPCVQIDSSDCSETSSSSSDLTTLKHEIPEKASRSERFYRRPCFIEQFDDDEETDII
ncbi:hypothetical protein PMAYCL1PPCAC_30510, partial [Pristionchus mayeri]